MGRKIIQVVQEVWNRKDSLEVFFGHFSRCLVKMCFQGESVDQLPWILEIPLEDILQSGFWMDTTNAFSASLPLKNGGGKEDYVLSYWVRGTWVGENSLLNFGWVAPNNLDVQGKKWDPGISIGKLQWIPSHDGVQAWTYRLHRSIGCQVVICFFWGGCDLRWSCDMVIFTGSLEEISIEVEEEWYRVPCTKLRYVIIIVQLLQSDLSIHQIEIT